MNHRRQARGWLLWIVTMIIAVTSLARSESSRADLLTEVSSERVLDGTSDGVSNQGRWVELTPLSDRAKSEVVMVSETGKMLIETNVPPGPTLLCTGGGQSAVSCEIIEIRGSTDAANDLEGAREVDVRFEAGVAVSGRIVNLLGEAVVGARVAIVPYGLRMSRPFTMPLSLEGSSSGRLSRELSTDEAGGFTSPSLAAGEYFLEILLPGARVHRGLPWQVPEVGGVLEVVDLGRVEIEPGLAVEVGVVDVSGVAVAAAQVSAYQGTNPADVRTFQGETDNNGRVLISDTDPELPIVLRCQATGFLSDRVELEVAEAFHQFRLVQLSSVVAQIVDVDGVALGGAAATARFLDLEGELHSVEADADQDGLLFLELPGAGDGTIAVTAPGHELRELPFRAAAGTKSDVGRVTLLAGRRILATVVDRTTRHGLEGVEIRAASPRGALAASSGSKGRFTAEVGTNVQLELTFELEPYVRRLVAFAPEQLQQEDLGEIALELGGHIRVVVTDESGELPCQGCPIRIEPQSQSLVTDSWGEAISEPLMPGSYSVYRPRITHLGSTVVVDEDAETHGARVEAGAVSTVRLGPRRRTVDLVFDPPLPTSWTLSARTAWRTERFFASERGSFEIGQGTNEKLEIFAHFYESGGYETAVRQGSLPPGSKNERVVLRLPAGGIDAELELVGGPLVGAEARLFSLVDNRLVATSSSDSLGRLVIPHVAAGAYVLYVGDRPLRFVVVGEHESVHLGAHQLAPGGY